MTSLYPPSTPTGQPVASEQFNGLDDMKLDEAEFAAWRALQIEGYVLSERLIRKAIRAYLASASPREGHVEVPVEALSKALKEYDRAVEWHSYSPHNVNREAEQHKAAAKLAEVVRAALPQNQGETKP